MYPLPVGLALVDMLAEHYEGRHERSRLARERGEELGHTARRASQHGRARLASLLGLRGRLVA
jgi:hypothetical protein